MNTKTKDILIRYGAATVGMLFVAFGVALSIISNLGTAALSCPSYVLNLKFPALSVGTFTLLVNCSYLLVQLAICGRRFKASYLWQVPASAIFGYMIDFCLWALSWLVPGGFVSRLLLILASCLVTAFGVSIEVIARGWMLSAEMTAYVMSRAFHKPFNVMKIVMDSTLVVISMVASFLFFRNWFGAGEYTNMVDILLARTPGVVIGLGTIISATLTGVLMKLTDPLVDRIVDKYFDAQVYRASSDRMEQ